VRVFAVAVVVKIALGDVLAGMSDLSRDVTAIGIVTALTLVYTFEGGLAAVIWTDVAQMAIYVGGALAGLFTLLRLVPGGWSTVHSVAGAAGKFRVFDFSLAFFTPYTFWSGLIGGAFLTTASHGTDQLIVQRLLAAKSARQSTLALLSSGVAVFLQFSLFLLIGAALYVFHGGASFVRTDEIFPRFIVSHLRHGAGGLLVAAILAAAMSNLSAALNALSSISIVDFYGRWRPASSESRRVLLSRVTTAIWGVVLFLLAIASRGGGKVVEVGLSIASVAYGALLGVFLLGVLTRKASEHGAMVGMVCGFCLNLYIWLASKIPWTWYVAIGCSATFLIGYAASGWRTLPNGPAGQSSIRKNHSG
jgi:Na+/proline symporter